MTSDDTVLKHLKKGTKYLECVSSGTIALQSNIAYGTWTWDWYKGDSNYLGLDFIAYEKNDLTRYYSFSHSVTNRGTLEAGIGSYLFYPVVNYVQINKWYSIKITRRYDGQFTGWIRGGNFGSNWTLIVPESGTNPATNNTYTTSKYAVLDMRGVGHRFTNLTIKEGIEV